jgi:lysophospholipase L1-like esterase
MKHLLPRILPLLLATAPLLPNHPATPTVHAQEGKSTFGENVQPRGAYANSRHVFERTGKGRVAFIGGSITEMDGYRPMVCESLKKRFPKTEFDFIAAGISSTCSTTGAFRLETDVLSKGPIDLLFVEFAVNDDQDAHHSRENCIRGLEGILQHARKSNPAMDIVVTFFVNEGMIETYNKGGVPLSVEAHESVAKRHNISTIHLGKEVATQIRDGHLSWKQFGGVHPAPFGNAICARMIDDLLNRMWVGPVADAIKPHPAQPAIDPLSYHNGRFMAPSRATLKEGWTLGVPDWKSLPGGKRQRFNSLDILAATTPGAELILDFEGTAVGAFVLAGPDAGTVEATIDNAKSISIDLYHAYSKGLHYPRTVMFGNDLAPGKHRLVLKVSATTTSSGNAIRIMQFTAN